MPDHVSRKKISLTVVIDNQAELTNSAGDVRGWCVRNIFRFESFPKSGMYYNPLRLVLVMIL